MFVSMLLKKYLGSIKLPSEVFLWSNDKEFQIMKKTHINPLIIVRCWFYIDYFIYNDRKHLQVCFTF